MAMSDEAKKKQSENSKAKYEENLKKKAAEAEKSSKEAQETNSAPPASPEKQETKPEGTDGVDKKQPGKKDMSWVNNKIKITLHEMEGMPSHQFVGLNGYTCIIKVGEEVEVPKAVLGVLNDAVITTKEYIPVAGMPGAYHVKDKIIRRFAVTSQV